MCIPIGNLPLRFFSKSKLDFSKTVSKPTFWTSFPTSLILRSGFPILIFSTIDAFTHLVFCGMYPSCFLHQSADNFLILVLSINISPDDGVFTPSKSLHSVLLPEPLGPVITLISPLWKVKFKFWKSGASPLKLKDKF